MFIFNRKRKLVDSDLFNGFVDYHTHILPAVDDGVQHLDESLAVLEYFEMLGLSKVIFTPHVMCNMGSDPTAVQRAFSKICDCYKGNIELSLAAEYMLDGGFSLQLERGLRTITSDCVLVETSYIAPPINLTEMLYETISRGVRPVIAHPERYAYMSFADYDSLRSSGYALQLNLLSLSGYYGRGVVERAEYLLNHDMYDLVGSDLHSLSLFKKWIGQIKLSTKQLDLLIAIKSGRI